MSLVDRMQVVFSRSSITNPPNQDVMTVGIHFALTTTVDATAPGPMTNAKRTLVEARWDTFYTAVKVLVQSYAVETDIKWYTGWPTADPPVPPVKAVTRSVAGSAGAAAGLPPQCCINCTLVTANRRHWGRFAIGGLAATTVVDGNGLLTAGNRGVVGSALNTFLAGCITDGVAPVVYRRPTYSYDSEHHRTGLIEAPTFRPVISSRVDDVLDIVRRRRYEHTTNRTINDLTVPMADLAHYGVSLPDVQ